MNQRAMTEGKKEGEVSSEKHQKTGVGPTPMKKWMRLRDFQRSRFLENTKKEGDYPREY